MREQAVPEAGLEPATPLREAIFKTADYANLSTRAGSAMLLKSFRRIQKTHTPQRFALVT